MRIKSSRAVADKSLEANLNLLAPPKWQNLPQIAVPNNVALDEDFKMEIERLRKGYVWMLRGYRAGVIQVIAGACAVAVYLEGNDAAWSQFCEHEVWRARTRKPNSAKPEEALRFVLLWITIDSKRASKWYNAVQPLHASGVKPENIADRIHKAGGIEMLAQANATAKKSQSRAKTAESGAIKREPAAKKATLLKLRAHLQEEAKGFLDLETGALANLVVKIGRKGSQPEITILEAEEIEALE